MLWDQRTLHEVQAEGTDERRTFDPPVAGPASLRFDLAPFSGRIARLAFRVGSEAPIDVRGARREHRVRHALDLRAGEQAAGGESELAALVRDLAIRTTSR